MKTFIEVFLLCLVANVDSCMENVFNMLDFQYREIYSVNMLLDFKREWGSLGQVGRKRCILGRANRLPSCDTTGTAQRTKNRRETARWSTEPPQISWGRHTGSGFISLRNYAIIQIRWTDTAGYTDRWSDTGGYTDRLTDTRGYTDR